MRTCTNDNSRTCQSKSLREPYKLSAENSQPTRFIEIRIRPKSISYAFSLTCLRVCLFWCARVCIFWELHIQSRLFYIYCCHLKKFLFSVCGLVDAFCVPTSHQTSANTLSTQKYHHRTAQLQHKTLIWLCCQKVFVQNFSLCDENCLISSY